MSRISKLVLPRHALAAFALVGSALSAPAMAQADLMPAAAAAAPVRLTWSASAARDLLSAIDAADEEGLDSAAYDGTALRRAIVDGEGAGLDAIATPAALALARDFATGRVADKSAFDWHIERSPYETAGLPRDLQMAVAQDRVGKWLRTLLPQNEQYHALRTALAHSRDATARDRIRANLERWRWMPRSLGTDYLYVNVPSYQLRVVEGGTQVSTYNVVVGAPKTPTPLLQLTASSVVVNPWWNVPSSIAKQGLGRGYQAVRTGDGVRYRQAPGPKNALGKVKIDMPNAHAIYLHDTPSKGGFAKDERALSHGCIRVQDIDQLAVELMRRDENRAAFEDAYATEDTRTLTLQDRWPVYLVYFTAEAADGSVRMLSDPYGNDAKLLAALQGSTRMARARGPVVLAAK